MLNTPHLSSKNIFAIPCDDIKRDDGKYLLLYAPLARYGNFLKHSELVQLELFLSNKSSFPGENLMGVLEKLSDQMPVPVNRVKNPADACSLTVLPNNKCNFSCSYCYSSEGHSSKELDLKHLHSVLDFFIDKDRVQNKDLYISFGGGGEPFLSWNIVENCLVYASEKAEDQGFRMNFSFASNGSVINEEIIQTLKKYRVKANISFDILENIQNLQRKHYDTVCRTLDMLLDADILPSINAVITPLNVLLQEKMVEEIARRFPKIKRLSFDQVVDAKLYEHAEDLWKFFSDYTDYFSKARNLGKSTGVDVNCIKLRNLDLIRDRACPGGFDLTPYGTISSCFFISSPKENLYAEFIYGKVDENGRLVFDTEKFHKNQGDSLNGKVQCTGCFAKWHCGGGCHYQNSTYTTEMLDVFCRFIREFTRRALIEKWDYPGDLN